MDALVDSSDGGRSGKPLAFLRTAHFEEPLALELGESCLT